MPDRVGAVLMGVAYFLMPLVGSILMLFIVRIRLCVGTTTETSMITTILHDYSAERARGKMPASVDFLMGIGAVLMNVIVGNLPERLVAQGVDAITAGRYMQWFVASYVSVSDLVILGTFIRQSRCQ